MSGQVILIEDEEHLRAACSQSLELAGSDFPAQTLKRIGSVQDDNEYLAKVALGTVYLAHAVPGVPAPREYEAPVSQSLGWHLPVEILKVGRRLSIEAAAVV